MRIVLTKLTDDRHRLAIVRADGSGESAELETRSLLLHDLVHYAVEAEAPIEYGFWGLLEKGTSMQAFADRTMTNPIHPDIVLAESLVGPMQSLYNGRLSKERYLEHAVPLAPEIVSGDFVDRVLARLRGLFGHWRATRFREDMTLAWPPSA